MIPKLLRGIEPKSEADELKAKIQQEEKDRLERLAVQILARPEWDAFRRLADDAASRIRYRHLHTSVQGRESEVLRDIGWLACYEEIINLPLRLEAALAKRNHERQAEGQAE